VQPQAPLQVQQGSKNVIQAQLQIQQGGTFALSHAQPQSQPQVANAQRLQQPAHHISSVHVASGTGVSNSMTPAGMGSGGNGAAAAPPPAAAAASASGRGFSGPSTNASRRKLPSSLAQQHGRGPGSGGGAGGSGGSTRGGAGSGAGGAGSGGCTPQQPQQQQQWGRGPHGPKQLPWSGGCVYACTPAEVDAACRYVALDLLLAANICGKQAKARWLMKCIPDSLLLTLCMESSRSRRPCKCCLAIEFPARKGCGAHSTIAGKQHCCGLMPLRAAGG
jgi:hypothetical protein